VTPDPPRGARWLLRHFLPAATREEIETDLLELFALRTQTRGRPYARRRYYADVISLWRGSLRIPARTRQRSAVIATLIQDLTYAARLFRRSPAVVGVTILGLGVAIGVSTSIFSFLNAVALRPTGIIDPSSAVRVLRVFQGGSSTSWPYAEFDRLRDTATNVTLAASLSDTVFFSTKPNVDSGQTAQATFVTGEYLAALNNRVTIGRLFTPMDDVIGAPPVAVLSHGFWSRRLGADPAIVGREIWINGAPWTVIGVARRGFMGTTDGAPSLWAPIATYHIALGGLPIQRSSSARLNVVGRIARVTAAAQAEAALMVAAAGVGNALGEPDGERLTGVRFEPAASRIMRGEAAMIALVSAIVMIAIGLLVLLACVNVANLLLASAIARQRELGVRLALGASRGRIVRQLLTESVSLGIAGGMLGLLLTIWLVPVLTRVMNAPGSLDVSADLRVYLFLAAISILAGLGAGLAPTRQTLRDAVRSPLKGIGAHGGGAAPSRKPRGILIGTQAAASLVFLVLAALLTRGMLRAATIEIGFDASRLLVVAPVVGRAAEDKEVARSLWELALERARAVPGVQAASLAAQSPFGDSSTVTIFKRAGSRYVIYHNATGADYFSLLGLRLVRGRAYTPEEVAGKAQVAVISETLARDFFPGEDPIGQPLNRILEQSHRIIVGVAANVITARLRELGAAIVYQPLEPTLQARLMVRTSGPPEAFIQSLRTALQPIDSRMRLDVRPVGEAVQKQLAEPRALASLAGLLAFIALALAVVGIYGVTTFVVGQRRQEIGVRMACGANAVDVMQLLLRDSLRPVVLGLGGGLIIAAVASRVFTGVLYGLSSADPVAFGGAVFILATAAACAVIVPTRRAAAAEPASVLREL
jgi:putative ABC transport system permease protein